MKKSYFLFFGLCLMALACTESIQLGADLVEDGDIEIHYTDTIAIPGKTVSANPPPTFRNSATFNSRTFLVGTLNSPEFGLSSSTTYFSATRLSVLPDLDDAVIDSIVMAIPLDTIGSYGDTTEVHELNLFQLVDPFILESSEDTLFSDLELAYHDTPLSTITTRINARDSISYYNPIADTIVRIIPQLRFKMDTAFWSPVLRDSLINETDTSIIEYVKGFALESSNATNSMFGINLQDEASAIVEIYYTVGDTMKELYLMDLGVYRHSFFNQDFTGSEVEAVIDQDGQDEFLYLQSMAGPNVELDLSFIDMLPNEILNKAVIEFTVPEPLDINAPINQILASYPLEDGKLAIIEDVSTRFLNFVFGGNLQYVQKNNGNFYYKYEINITNHVINIVNGEIDNKRLILSGLAKSERPNQSKIFGPSHPEFPVLLKLITTKP
ncbi:MAG: DUF4270 family protein [Saprospiraceae bacterium]|nr:DUF4270 family protein [Saprospiraceae bacterium]